ncbi:MAG: NADH-ubiquinone oxidoreductase-F iron-sulfur binding region domain-containing protein [bacterium]|nr:NADH-ubiquinone oxidoreductase-F iron-sulfur binding region domain-containing protein [bacterium]
MDKKIVLLKDTSIGAADKTKEYYSLILNLLRDQNLQDSVQVVRVADIGFYDQGLVLKILPGQVTYGRVQESDLLPVITETIQGNKVLDRLALEPNEKQLRIVLRNCGQIDPENFDDYIAADGYAALKKVITEYKPEQVIEQLKASGLRGRGGAGYPTWMKWNFARQVKAEQKYIVCNGDEGDPGAYMDRSVLEGDPHSVIEGMMIGAYAIGASQGYFYIRAEYPLAVERIQKAIAQAYEYGLLGKNILGTDFSFDVEIRLGAGAFVCGEETALLASIEGKRGTPQPRPPYPSIKGLWGKPTVINNVETLANIPVILLKGGAWFGKIGTEKSKGTKVFALTGKIKNSGLIEVPMGTTIRDIVYHIGGGMLASKGIKAVQTGGPSGGVIPKEFLDEPVDYENLQKLGSIMGSGGMIVMDEDDCLVDIAKFYLKFCVEESCGKCAPCRIGGFQMLSLLENITSGKGTASDLAKMRRIALAMQKASLCGLGQTASNPVLSTLKYFAAEYKSHIEDKKCVAGKCRYLLNYQIIPEKCKKCGLCLTNCVFGAITGNREQGYILDPAKCTKCGRCYEVCKFKAINKG